MRQPPGGDATLAFELHSIMIDRLSYRLPEAAKLLGVSEKTLKRACQQGLIRSAKLGKIHTISAAELARVAAEGFEPPAPDGAKKPPPVKRGRPKAA